MKAIIQTGRVVVAVLILIGFAGLPDSTSIITTPDQPVSVSSFGRMHTIVGAADAVFSDDNFTVRARSESEEFGVAVALNSDKALNLYFDPIAITNGSTLRANLYNSASSRMVTVNHYQRSASETDIAVSLEGLMPLLTSSDLTITTYSGGEATHSEIVSAKSSLNLGTVTTDDDEDEWVKTWHIVCVDGNCELFVDPDNTEFEFVAAPGVLYPFEYLGIRFESNASFDSGVLELVGSGIGPINITGEDTVPLDLVNTLDLQ